MIYLLLITIPTSFDIILTAASMAARAWILSVEDRKKLIEGAFEGK